jgi:hypothetical protein
MGAWFPGPDPLQLPQRVASAGQGRARRQGEERADRLARQAIARVEPLLECRAGEVDAHDPRPARRSVERNQDATSIARVRHGGRLAQPAASDRAHQDAGGELELDQGRVARIEDQGREPA